MGGWLGEWVCVCVCLWGGGGGDSLAKLKVKQLCHFLNFLRKSNFSETQPVLFIELYTQGASLGFSSSLPR